MANWTSKPQPFGPNRTPALFGTSSTDGVTAVPVAVDPATGAVLTEGGGSGGGGTQYTQGGATVTNPTGNSLIYFNGSNQPIAVTSANPLPITGTISVGSTADESAFTAGTSTTGPVAGVFNDSVASLTSGQQGTTRSTATRALHTNLRNNTGTEVGTSTTPFQVSLANTASNATSVKVDGSGVTQPVSLTSTAVTQATAASLNATVVGTGTLAVQNTAATPAGTNIIGKVGIDQTTPGTTNKVDIADSLNNPVSAFPATFLRTTDEPHQVFYDPFDSTLDVTNVWTSSQGSSGVAASNTTGVMSMGTGTAANGYSKLTSQASFKLPIPAWLGASDAIAIPDLASPTANAYRFWGVGTTPGTPTATAPLTDAVGFELTTAGKMIAVVWAGATRTVIQDLSSATGNSTQPTDANTHRYIVYIRTDKAYWYIDGITSAQLVATSNFQSPQVQTLPRLFLAVGGSTPPASNAQITCTGATAWDTGKNATQMADGTFPWRKATVSSAGALKVDGSAVTQPVSLTSTTITGTVAVTESGTWQNQITDGINTANVIAGDSGFNGIGIANATKTYNFTTLTTGAQTILANTPTEGFSTIEVVYTSVGAGLGITGGQFSSTSGGTYVSTANFASGTSGFSGALGTTVNTIYVVPVRGNFFQIAVSALTSGTFAGSVTLRASTPQASGVQASQTGTWTVGSNSATGTATPANAFSVGGTDGTSLRAISVSSTGVQYVLQRADTSTLSNIASSATSVVILATNTARKGASVYNDSTQILYLKFGTTASTTSFTVPLAAAAFFEVPSGYTGEMDGIWTSANGNARVTEIT